MGFGRLGFTNSLHRLRIQVYVGYQQVSIAFKSAHCLCVHVDSLQIQSRHIFVQRLCIGSNRRSQVLYTSYMNYTCFHQCRTLALRCSFLHSDLSLNDFFAAALASCFSVVFQFTQCFFLGFLFQRCFSLFLCISKVLYFK